MTRNNSSKETCRPIGRLPNGVRKTWTRRGQKHGKSHYDYKLSVSVDKQHTLIRLLVTDTASTHDCQHFEVVLGSDEYTPNRLCRPQ